MDAQFQLKFWNLPVFQRSRKTKDDSEDGRFLCSTWEIRVEKRYVNPYQTRIGLICENMLQFLVMSVSIQHLLKQGRKQ